MMANPILDLFQKTRNMNIKGGHARYQVEFEMLNDARRLVPSLRENLVPCLKRCLRDTDFQIQIWAVDICDAVPLRYKQDVIQMLRFRLQLEEKRTGRNNLQLCNRMKAMLSKLGDDTPL